VEWKGAFYRGYTLNDPPPELNDEAAVKLLYLAIRNIEKKWTRQPQYWNRALNQFAIMFEGRLPA